MVLDIDHDYPREYTTCRSIGHMWIETDVETAPQWGVPLWLRCERCNSVRKDVYDINGNLSHRSYAHSEGFLRQWGSDRPTRHDFRMILLAKRMEALRQSVNRRPAKQQRKGA